MLFEEEEKVEAPEEEEKEESTEEGTPAEA